ncbi:MAG: hypothetical protein GYA87_06610 [Christensenellaceae bacterium]|nr:hypothetical protein [Christensenellaceae bacterium]
MFGFRPEGRKVQNMDPLVEITSYIMPTRVDAQVFLNQEIRYDVLANYIAKKAKEGYKITFMEIIIAAFVRAVSQLPEVNRFVVNKTLYSRKELTVSFAILKHAEDDNPPEETVVKVKFDPYDTLYDVVSRVKKDVIENQKPENSNSTLKLVKFLMNVPMLPTIVVGFAKLLDRYGLLPKVIIDLSPFHTSMFITNMASIGMSNVNHHIYNFGTTTLFVSMGAVKRSFKMLKDGSLKRNRLLPLGITADERVCAGAVYAKLFAYVMDFLNEPEKLETPPETVRFDKNCEYSEPKVDLKYSKINFE